MYYLSSDEQAVWEEHARQAMDGKLTPRSSLDGIRNALRAHFHFYMGGLLAGLGKRPEAADWFREGALEEDGIFNAIMASYLERHNGRFYMPEKIFADPRDYEHFTTVPAIVGMREKFLRFASSSLPRFADPLTVLDVGCGDGSLLVLLLQRLMKTGRAQNIARAILVDSSASMMEVAEGKLRKAFPELTVDPRHGRIQEHAGELPAGIDIALLSLAYHHMPCDAKAAHLREMSGKVKHLLLMEMDGDNDTPQLGSPELAVSVYQSYGPLIDSIFAHDAPITVTQSCVDNFVMAEVISFLTEPRGRRNDYHMLRGQWERVFRENLDGHHPRGEATVLASDGCEFFACHWGR
ncbi:MAG: class I SAM-dependent methyltransferase [Smithellaceae bacterium]|jgi:SAM-dependent methyltransferase|nr:class I SAM-dependent methyltransferase [Smithellaceae bacterium]MDD3259698.1 class I SAM-dependent methyltransferase [Smithellaceae bacterium]MDD3849363.1 class I SAM-dependent methyltransferase [Smithellaceae bacterium]